MGDSIGAFAFWLAVGFGALGLFFSPIGRALGRRLEPSRRSGEPDDSRTVELEARLADLERLSHRVGELEERLDFAERMLAQQRDPARLADGGG